MMKVVEMNNCGNLLSEEKATSEKPLWLKYFFLMGEEEREAVEQWLSGVVSATEEQADFIEVVEEALKSVDYDYRIAVIEPSMDGSGKLFYNAGEQVARRLSGNEWKVKGKEFAPEWGSSLANLHELFLWYAYRIAKGLWTLEYVCNDNSNAGNSANSPDASHGFEVSGKRKVGGFEDGIGNTYKIVAYNAYFAACGGHCLTGAYCHPVTHIFYYHDPNYVRLYGSGVLVLKP